MLILFVSFKKNWSKKFLNYFVFTFFWRNLRAFFYFCRLMTISVYWLFLYVCYLFSIWIIQIFSIQQFFNCIVPLFHSYFSLLNFLYTFLIFSFIINFHLFSFLFFQNHALMMAKTDEYRARTEEYEFLRASVPSYDRRGNENVFEWTLR